MLRITLFIVFLLALIHLAAHASEPGRKDSLLTASANPVLPVKRIMPAGVMKTDTGFSSMPIHLISIKTSEPETSSGYNNWLSNKYIRQSIVPVSLACISLSIMEIPALKFNLQNELNWDHDNKVVLFDDQLRYGPLVAGAILVACGVQTRHGMLSQAGLIASSYILSDLIVYRTKQLTKEKRPGSADLNSFPSQHASMAFVAATLLHREMGYISPWISIGGYSLAGWVAYSRVARNRHYLNDVLMGSAIGLFVTNGVYWTYDAIVPSLLKKIAVTPVISPEQKGISVSYNF